MKYKKNTVKTMIKGMVAFISCLGFIGSASITSLAAASDYENHWAATYLNNLYDYRIMSGDELGNMRPNSVITRAEFVSMANRAFGYNQYQKGKSNFSDISGTEWYADDINIAYDNGYFYGDGNMANPNEYLTREQAVSLLCRNLKIEETDLGVSSFSDSRTFSNWSKGFINAAAKKGIISGYDDNSFRPTQTITRAEAAKIFSDSIGTLIGDSGEYNFGVINSNITIASPSVTLKNTVVNGDLYITNGIGTGGANLENVTVIGDVIISGGGRSDSADSSIKFKNCSIKNLIVDSQSLGVGEGVSLISLGNNSINKATIKSDVYLEDFTGIDQGFKYIEMKGEPKTSANLAGYFGNVKVIYPENNVYVNKGFVETMTVDEDSPNSLVVIDDDAYINTLNLDAACSVNGLGDIGTLNVAALGSDVKMLPDVLTIRPGLTAKIGGKEMDSKSVAEYSELPKIIAGYPMEDEIGPVKASIKFKTNKSGKVYWGVSTAENGALTLDEVKKPDTSKIVIKSGILDVKTSYTDVMAEISGLTPDTKYCISAILIDSRGQESLRKTNEFKTQDNTIPGFNSGYPKVFSENSTGLSIDIVTNKDCTVYWGVFPKGSLAPTISELKNNTLKGAKASGVEKKCLKNIERIFSAQNLEEREIYDVYILASDGLNESKLVKITAQTKDTTPPEFIKDYPKPDKITEKSVDVRVKVNEDSTVYFVAVKKGTLFPTPVPPETEPPQLTTEIAKDAIVTGNNTVKNGKTNVKADTEAILKVNGLQSQTAYNIFMVAVDKTGNKSIGQKITMKTTDVIPPEATQEFSDDINGEPKVSSDITVVFNEEVWDRASNGPITNKTLPGNIVLYEVIDNRELPVKIDYTKVEIIDAEKDQDGRTLVKFPAGSLALTSGSKYRFALSYIIDTSYNRMRDGLRLPDFKTVPPQVLITRNQTPPDNIDMAFILTPQEINTADTVLFDIILESEKNVKFELYEKIGDGEYTKVTTDVNEPIIYEKGATTIHYIFDKMLDKDGDGKKEFVFEKFNALTPREYGIKFTELDGSRDRGSWSETFKIGVKCVIGSKVNLEALASDPTPDKLKVAIEAGVAQVNNPLKFEMPITFTDTVIPSFLTGYPQLENKAGTTVATPISQIADTLIRPNIMTNKRADFYYLVAPKDALNYKELEEGLKNPANGDKAVDLSAIQIMSGKLKPLGSVTGSYTVESGGTLSPVIIEGLKPEMEYNMFYFLKGTPPEPSTVWVKPFKTVKVAPPQLKLQVTERGENTATILMSTDKDATIDWLLVPENECKGWFDSNGKLINPQKTAEKIRNGEEDTTIKITDFGTAKTRYNKNVSDYPFEAEVVANDIKRNIYYTCFAVAKSSLGDGVTDVGDDSEVVFITRITPADKTPPEITVDTIIKNAKVPTYEGEPYEGEVSITFNEEAYYIPSDGATMLPLTYDIFKDNTSFAGGTFKYGIYNTQTVGDVKGVKVLRLYFGNVYNNSTVYFPYNICDRNNNIGGNLKLTFIDAEAKGGSRSDSKFVFEYVVDK